MKCPILIKVGEAFLRVFVQSWSCSELLSTYVGFPFYTIVPIFFFQIGCLSPSTARVIHHEVEHRLSS
ncbi:Hypothetical protein SRAE_2000110700 [Strongyloides ratti]|uniref:Bestrophin homolog n=1 Tax=Strongyloides ratti TaxID=34506 RepID=A0A090MY24_STRRB|nr:Hypothetical protein SRAE_2000110700 [Strongyloides ratti]CEF66439.1 Hypothetical protein SRAE_2000110700 [Strongyloides ratti]